MEIVLKNITDQDGNNLTAKIANIVAESAAFRDMQQEQYRKDYKATACDSPSDTMCVKAMPGPPEFDFAAALEYLKRNELYAVRHKSEQWNDCFIFIARLPHEETPSLLYMDVSTTVVAIGKYHPNNEVLIGRQWSISNHRQPDISTLLYEMTLADDTAVKTKSEPKSIQYRDSSMYRKA